ncbi:DgyrCDS8701 [Dimorphilus gyrociliatus]|uniref:Neutral ceramidase n=1 Tax=Dimorphilus gyrociliatus TaxID=2664684 RepID=A0A7I8VXA2_9ANNE|nr:DgyrCDS8701 [Dimorphilus gyrociliatus]
MESIHDNRGARNQLIIVAILCAIFMIGEIVGGIIASSLALLSDALHLGSDLAGFIISLVALWLAKKPANSRMTFGYYRAEVVGALISVIIIWLVTAILVYAAVLRIKDQNYEIKPLIMLITASAGVAFNITLGIILHCSKCHCNVAHGHSHGADRTFIIDNDALAQQDSENSNNTFNDTNTQNDNINVKAALIHVIGDLIQSCGVVIASVIILIKPQYKIADPICTFLFSVLVLISTIRILREIGFVIMEGSPNESQLHRLESDLKSNSLILSIHDLHVWSLTTNRLVASVHIVVNNRQVETKEIENFATELLKRKYGVRAGISDMTGLLSEGIMFGYAKQDQEARGLHLRQFSRAYVVADRNGNSRFALLSIEVATSSDAIRDSVVEKLRETYGDLYTHTNVMITAQHTHSAPAGYHTYWMFQTAAGGGFVNATFQVYVDAIVDSIKKAHNNLKPGNVLFNEGDLLNANINRSPAAYYNNPKEERDKYEYDVEKRMSLLKFVAEDGSSIGSFSFFPVHTTSMFNSNHLVSSDNKGVAALLMEKDLNNNAFPGQGSIVTSFAQSCQGDASPNVNGFYCDTGEPCDYWSGACDDDVRRCQARGPGSNMYENTVIIGERQYRKAKELFESSTEVLQSDIGSVHQWVNFTGIEVESNGQTYKTCAPAMGYSFAAGAVDGPALGPPFVQGLNESDPVIDTIRDLILPASEELLACHEPKPILISSGEADDEWPWQPEVLPLQVFRLGRLIILGIPAEVTTMSSRRFVAASEQVMRENGIDNPKVIVAGVTNMYINYIVTPEEYEIQRYEGASTVFGQYTLNAYIEKLKPMIQSLIRGEAVEPGTPPPDLRDKPEEILEPIRTDLTPNGFDFGDVLNNTNEAYKQNETVTVVFVCGNPRNNLMTGNTFLTVEKENGGSWTTVFTDAHIETRYYWESNCEDDEGEDPSCETEQSSKARITWDIPINQDAGTYRISHFGHARLADGTVKQYEGRSGNFEVRPL